MAKTGGGETLIDFYKLTRPVQERFRGSVNRTGLPAPILEHRGGTREPLAWLGGAAGCLLLALILFRVGIGNLESVVSIQSPAFVVAYTALFGGAIFAVLKALAIRRETRSLPFNPGVYVFPIGLVDARRAVIRLRAMGELTRVEGPDAANLFRLKFGQGTYLFSCGDADRARMAADALSGARNAHRQAEGERESMRPKALAAIDPLQDGGFASPLVPKTPILQLVPFWASRAWLLALGTGFLAAVAVWNARNVVSDARMFTTANETRTVASYKSYLVRGTRHHDEVEQILLPRAELREAQAAGSVEAIERFMKVHPHTKIGTEVAAALRSSLLAELEETKKAGTVTALAEFIKRHPDHHLDPELKRAKHEVYDAAYRRYIAESASADPASQAFIKRTLDHAEKNGPRVLVRFQRKIAKSMERADKEVGKSRSFMGVQSFATRYYDAAHARPREEELGRTIAARFAQAFPLDVLSLDVGDPVGEEEAIPANVTMPTLFIEHTTEWSGGVVNSDRPRGVFIMMGVNFDATFKLPDDAKPLRFKHTLWRRPDPALGKENPEHPEEPIYAAMTKDGFDSFGRRLLAGFFRAEKKS